MPEGLFAEISACFASTIFLTPVSFADSPFQGQSAFASLRPVAPLLRFPCGNLADAPPRRLKPPLAFRRCRRAFFGTGAFHLNSPTGAAAKGMALNVPRPSSRLPFTTPLFVFTKVRGLVSVFRPEAVMHSAANSRAAVMILVPLFILLRFTCYPGIIMQL